MKIEILDSTLRDGAQGEGISFSVDDKINIARALDSFGISIVEAGIPGANMKDMEFYRRMRDVKLKNATLAAFGSTRRKGVSVEEDMTVKALLKAQTPVVVIFGKSWDMHVDSVICTSLEENLAMIRETVAYFTGFSKRVIYDAEHFFDGYKSNKEYAISTIEAAACGGADCITLCDTNGGTFLEEIKDIMEAVVPKIKVNIGIHCHNDCGLAMANSLVAVCCGANHVQGTFLGYGERCGNANLSAVIANLQLKQGYTCIPQENMHTMRLTARYIAEVSNVTIGCSEPYIGTSAFAHKAGMHVDGVQKTANAFEHIDPGYVGGERRILMSEMAGRAAVLAKIGHIFPDMTRDSLEAAGILERLKQLERDGYQFEGAESSFELMVYKHLGKYKPFFELKHFKVISDSMSQSELTALAIVKVSVNGKEEITAAEGDGPVNALDRALRRVLEIFYPCLKNVRLTDYKVRVLNPGRASAAKVRVLITSTDGETVWSTVGVSSDIIEASWLALVDSVEYKLIRNK